MKKLICLFLLVSFSLTHLNAQSKNGWTNLFDGKTLNGWKRLAGTADYQVQNGEIVGTTVTNPGNTFLVTEKEFKDFILEMDVKIEDTSSNSGVQVRSHYDPAGHGGKGLVYGKQFEIDPSSRKWSGGIYDEGRRDWLYPSSYNPKGQNAFRVGEYNHIKMEVIGNEMKTWINNIPVAYVVDTMDKTGFIALQVHAVSNPKFAGEKVHYKNIKIKTTGLQPTSFPPGIYVFSNVSNTLTGYEKRDGWKLLFDGKTSNGWVSAGRKVFPAKGWAVKDGTLNVASAGGTNEPSGGDIITTDKYSVFDLSFDFKMSTGANSGLKYFVTVEDNKPGSALGLEFQVLDDKVHPDAKLGRDGDRTLASLYDLIPAKKQERFIHPIGQWNTGRVVVYPNNHVEHYLNGIKVLEYERGSQAFRDVVALSKFKNVKDFGETPAGYILLQDHGHDVSFKNIKIKTLQNQK
ncbi:MAG: hypothetical protein JWN76_1008 [Chitinophagaceae bacterium]|nr:hypothetical protein [Chitinophagaceae bacterium]